MNRLKKSIEERDKWSRDERDAKRDWRASMERGRELKKWEGDSSEVYYKMWKGENEKWDRELEMRRRKRDGKEKEKSVEEREMKGR